VSVSWRSRCSDCLDRFEPRSENENENVNVNENDPESSDGEVMVPATPPRPAGKRRAVGESQGGTTIVASFKLPTKLIIFGA
jgi:hypothetical protein